MTLQLALQQDPQQAFLLVPLLAQALRLVQAPLLVALLEPQRPLQLAAKLQLPPPSLEFPCLQFPPL